MSQDLTTFIMFKDWIFDGDEKLAIDLGCLDAFTLEIDDKDPIIVSSYEGNLSFGPITLSKISSHPYFECLEVTEDGIDNYALTSIKFRIPPVYHAYWKKYIEEERVRNDR